MSLDDEAGGGIEAFETCTQLLEIAPDDPGALFVHGGLARSQEVQAQGVDLGALVDQAVDLLAQQHGFRPPPP